MQFQINQIASFYQPHPNNTNLQPFPIILATNGINLNNMNSSNNSGINVFYESYEKRLLELFLDPQNNIQQRSYPVEATFSKIEAKFVAVDFQSKIFIHSLVKVGCRICLDVSYKIDRNCTRNYFSLLSIFIGNNLEFQMEALLAIQEFVQRFRKQLEANFIIVLFEYLYQMKIICKEVFIKWKNESGKSLTINTLKLLKSFFESFPQRLSQY